MQGHEQFFSRRLRLSWGGTLLSCLGSHTVSVSSLQSTLWCVFHILWLLLVIFLFKRAPSAVLKCCLVVLSTQKLWCAFQRKCVCFMRFVQIWVTVLWAMSSMSMNQQHVLNKVSLSRNTRATKLCIDRLIKSLVIRGSQEATLYFPGNKDLAGANSVFVVA